MKVIYWLVFLFLIAYLGNMAAFNFHEFMIQEAIGQEQTETGETETTQEELEDSCE